MLQNVNHDVQYTGLTFFYNYFLLYFSDGHAQISGKDICIYNIQEQVSSLVSTLAVFSAELKKKEKKKGGSTNLIGLSKRKLGIKCLYSFLCYL